MKSTAFTIHFWLLGLLLTAVPQHSHATDILTGRKAEFTKVIKKETNITQNGTVEITGKYGNINVSTWNRSKAAITVKIVVKAPNKAKADELFDRIDIDFGFSRTYASAAYRIDNNGGGNWWNAYKSMSYEIHYDVKIPQGASVKLNNQYGHIFTTDIGGSAQLDNKYGNIKTGNINGTSTDLLLGYGKADLGKVKTLRAEIKYAKLDLAHAERLDIESKYSQLHIDAADEMRTQSKYDKYNIGKVQTLYSRGKYDDYDIQAINDLDATSRYSDYHLRTLSGMASLDMGYGDATIDKLDAQAQKIDFVGSYANLILNLNGHGLRYTIDGEYTNLNLPRNAKATHKHQDGQKISTRGSIGSSRTTLKARTRYGSVRIRD